MYSSSVRLCIAFLLVAVPIIKAYGLPEGIEIVGGDVSLSQDSDDVLTIHQQSDTASISFTDFSIDVHETVNILQPHADAIALGRVLGVNPSEIFGNLNANGQFFLINPNGIVFGENASVNVSGLIATTLSLSDEDLFAGNFTFKNIEGSDGAGVINEGNLTAIAGGYIALISDSVTNSGVINADEGGVSLISADTVTITFSDVNTPTISLDKATYNGIVSNIGVIQAQGGMVVMSAAVSDALMETVVNNEGIIEAQGVEYQQGRVFLTSTASGDVVNNGSINVSSSHRGGDISISGDRVAQLGQLHADGLNGGTVDIQGDKVIALGEHSEISVNGHDAGGSVIAIAQEKIIFRDGAAIRATGGQKGGFVEVSGYESVEIQGLVDTSSENGESGTFLIDPFDVTITGATNNNAQVGGVFTPSGATSTINVATLEANLALGDVRIETTNGAGTESGDLTVATAINLDNSNGNTLTLQADGSLLINNSISDQNTATADATTLQLVAGGNIQISDGVEVNAGGGTISLTAGGNVTLTGLVSSNTAANALTVIGATISDAGETVTDIDVNAGGVSLSVGAGNIDGLETAVGTLSASISGGGRLAITEQDDLTLQTLSGVNDVDLVTTGTLTVQDAGLTISNSIDIQAADLVDSDRTVSIATADATLQLTASVGDVTLQTAVDRLDVSLTGLAGNTASLTIVESNGLQIEDLDGDTNALVVSNGNLSVLAALGNITINDTVIASDLTDNGVRTGLVDIQLDQGDLIIGDQGATTIQSINTVDNTDNGGLGALPTNQVSIRLLHNDMSDQSHAFTLGNGAGSDVTILAQGGDILIDSFNGAALTLGNTRTITVNSDVQISSYNAAIDTQDGAVDVGSVVSLGSITAHTGRAITLRENETLDVDSPEVVVDISTDITETIKEESDLVPSSGSAPVGRVSDASRLFSSVFTLCESVTGSSSKKNVTAKAGCELEQSVQQFLGALLIGGDLPTEGTADE